MPQTVIALFNRAAEAREAETALLRSGFTNDMVDVSNSPSITPVTNERQEGTIRRFFRELFGQEDEAERYTAAAGASDSVVTVHAETPDDAVRASRILDDAGAIDIDEQPAAAPLETASGEVLAVDVIEEDLQVGKRVVETGGVRVRSRIVEHPVEESVRLREERVVVERLPVDRAASPADLEAFQSGELEVVERAEVPVIHKEARVVEEVSLSKEVDERTETVRETVRNTEVDVEELPTPGGRVGVRSRDADQA